MCFIIVKKGETEMKCHKCNEKAATILIRQTLNGVDYEYSVCEDCAKTLGLWNTINFNSDFPTGGNLFMPIIFPKFSTADLGGAYNSSDNPGIKKEQLKCDNCNSTIDDIRKTGRMGCSNCYDVFEKSLVEVFRRVQSGEMHRGRKKAQSAEKVEIRLLRNEISNLQNKIKQAVIIEDYESAAIYKSQIGEKEILIENLIKMEKLETLDKNADSETNGNSNDSIFETDDKDERRADL